MKKNYKKYIAGGLAMAITTTTLGTATPVFAHENSSVREIIQMLNLSTSELAEYDRITNIFVEQYGKEGITEVVNQSLGVTASPKEERGAVSITAKVLLKLLKEKGSAIIKAIKKIPGVGTAIGNFLEKHMGSLINFLEKVNGGAEAALIRFFTEVMGLKQSTAEIWADVIMTVVGMFL